MKQCFKCGVFKELGDFYKHKQMGDGYLGKCKECTKADVTKRRNENIEAVREYDRKRGNLPHRVTARKEYAKTEKGKMAFARATKRYRQNNPEKYKATCIVNNAVRDGKLTRGACEVCGSQEKVHAHHEDYSKPLEVKWLCATHHVELHNGHKK